MEPIADTTKHQTNKQQTHNQRYRQYNTQHPAHNAQHGTRNTQHSDVLCIVSSLLCIVCCKLCVVCSVFCVLCSVSCVLCSVFCCVGNLKLRIKAKYKRGNYSVMQNYFYVHLKIMVREFCIHIMFGRNLDKTTLKMHDLFSSNFKQSGKYNLTN